MATATTQKQRTLRIVLEFAANADGVRCGGIRIDAPGAEPACYYVFAEGDKITFRKDGGDNSVHVVDLDYPTCDCPGHRRWHKCRHVSAALKLKQLGHL